MISLRCDCIESFHAKNTGGKREIGLKYYLKLNPVFLYFVETLVDQQIFHGEI